MEHANFHVVYVDKRASPNLDGRYLSRFAPESAQERQLENPQDAQLNCFEILDAEDGIVRHNLRMLLFSFQGGNDPVLVLS